MYKLLSISILLLSVTTAWSGLKIKQLGSLPNKLQECSGLELVNEKYLIAHNDGGNKNELYIINDLGQITRTIHVLGAKNEDWEDVTSASDGRFFIGDIGNNLNKRAGCTIYILDKDFIEKGSDSALAEKITFIYDDQKNYPPSKSELYYDAEALFWMNDSLYILSKCRAEPFTGRSFVYVLPDKPGKYKARKIGEIPFCSTGWMFCSVTAADYHEPSKTLAVLLYGKLVLIRNFKSNQFWKGEMKTFNIPKLNQREALTFINANSWYMSDEIHRIIGGGKLYKVELK